MKNNLFCKINCIEDIFIECDASPGGKSCLDILLVETKCLFKINRSIIKQNRTLKESLKNSKRTNKQKTKEIRRLNKKVAILSQVSTINCALLGICEPVQDLKEENESLSLDIKKYIKDADHQFKLFRDADCENQTLKKDLSNCNKRNLSYKSEIAKLKEEKETPSERLERMLSKNSPEFKKGYQQGFDSACKNGPFGKRKDNPDVLGPRSKGLPISDQAPIIDIDTILKMSRQDLTFKQAVEAWGIKGVTF